MAVAGFENQPADTFGPGQTLDVFQNATGNTVSLSLRRVNMRFTSPMTPCASLRWRRNAPQATSSPCPERAAKTVVSAPAISSTLM